MIAIAKEPIIADVPVQPRYHKRIRLDAPLYAQPDLPCSITIAVKGRVPVFAKPDVAAATVSVLRERAEVTLVQVYAYCIMPDHVHLLLAASPICDIPTFVGQFKNLTQRAAWKLGVIGAFWQTSFWDHFLRVEEDVRPVIEYILNNPVRAGLVDQRKEYPFSGSLVYDKWEE